jgi:hypothetical protein
LPPDTTSRGDVSAIAFVLTLLAIALAVVAYFFGSSLNAYLFGSVENSCRYAALGRGVDAGTVADAYKYRRR